MLEPNKSRTFRRPFSITASAFSALACVNLLSRASCASIAFWVAQQILDGNKDVPHDLLVPYLAWVTYATALNGTIWRLNG